MTVNLHKIGKKLLLGFAIAVLAGVIAVCAAAAHAGSAGIAGAENADRVHFLAECGWQVEEEPLSAQEVQIPTEFSDVYEQYNQLNQQAGFDLHAVAGKACKQYCYRVTNYQGDDEVHATLLVENGRIVGGDVSSAALDGFMVPLRQSSTASSQ